MQVGTWQRNDQRFRLAAEMVRAGRLGKIRKVSIVLGKNETGGPFPTATAPKNLNWDRWLGQAPTTPYIPERCHYTFRYWYEYAGGEKSGKIDAISNHMGNFYDCTASRRTPISSLASQHRVASACHLAILAVRLGRPLRWNPQSEQFVDDAQANTYLAREQRKGYEVT